MPSLTDKEYASILAIRAGQKPNKLGKILWQDTYDLFVKEFGDEIKQVHMTAEQLRNRFNAKKSATKPKTKDPGTRFRMQQLQLHFFK
jgi:hypothetical protein